MAQKILHDSGSLEVAGPGVRIVGAGPGDPDLLTLRAIKALETADVIFFDHHVSDSVLEFSNSDAERIYVGKRAGHHTASQDQINALMIGAAGKGQSVVRLKGGDPSIFGRVGEEIEALEGAGIKVEIIPGVTAASGCAAGALFPLTARGYASSVSFVTGKSKSGEVPELSGFGGPGRTLVIYMGLGQSVNISRALLDDGLSPDTPVAVIEKGTLQDQRVFTGILQDLAEVIEKYRVEGPGLIVVGDVAALVRVPSERLNLSAAGDGLQAFSQG